VRLLLVLLLALLPGCVFTHVVRVGKPHNPRPGCQVKFERLAFQDAIGLYDQVGAVCANVADDAVYDSGWFADLVRSTVGEQVCDLGGDLATPIGTCSINRMPGVELGIFRSRP
jgi:hypothetical protein